MFLIATKNSFCQNNDQWKKYLQDSVYAADNTNYVYLYSSKGGILEKSLRISIKKSKQILSANYGDTLIQEKEILQPDIFALIKSNLKEIKKVSNYLNDGGIRMREFNKSFSDKNLTVSQLGIKVRDLHYNHFPEFTLEEIENKRNRKFAEGMKIINQIRLILSKAG